MYRLFFFVIICNRIPAGLAGESETNPGPTPELAPSPNPYLV